ncbi:hypothetical protein AU387_15725 [Bacillus halotolerans]|uniref:hypothetical protein n=1 Tax=Bacillus halotolerans TaxID=260554 RepID=UPI0007517833|nr:hypothetical protein [Bacillus halotolerans]KUP31106.1 hypothetical protein AU387_15725 [Bacillus halotolerans]
MAKLEGVKTLDMVNGEITKVAYGGAAYERVEGGARKGDIVRLADKAEFQSTPGGFYDVIAGGRSAVCVLDDYGAHHNWTEEWYDLFRKIADATNPSVEERVAKAEGEIESLKSDVAALKGEAEYTRIGKSEARAGDYVKFIETNDSSITVGKMYEIVNIDYEGYLDFIDDDGDKNCGVSLEVFEVYRKVNAASVEAEPKPYRLKVGDYAKVVKRIRDHSAEIGEIVIVKMDDKIEIPYKCDKLNGERSGWFYEDELVRATDKEVAEAKRVAAEAAEHKKWAEIGREVGEYKKGDIARVVDNQCAGHVSNGDIIEVLRQDSSGSVLDTVHEYYLRVELITPVEARFDR